MKFIKTKGGRYINADQVKYLYVDGRGVVFACFGVITGSEGVVIAEEALPLGTYGTKAESQAWLEKLVAELNSEAPT